MSKFQKPVTNTIFLKPMYFILLIMMKQSEFEVRARFQSYNRLKLF